MTSTLRWYFLTQNAARAQARISTLSSHTLSSHAAYEVLNEVGSPQVDDAAFRTGRAVVAGDTLPGGAPGRWLPNAGHGPGDTTSARADEVALDAAAQSTGAQQVREAAERACDGHERSALLVAPPWFGVQLEDVAALMSSEGGAMPAIHLVVGLAPELSAADTLAWQVACGARFALHIDEAGSVRAVVDVSAPEQPRAAAQVAQIRALLRTQQRLVKEIARVEELSEQRRAFLRNVSHELATPLTPIVGYVTLLLKEDLGPLTDIQRKAIEGMRSAGTRLRSVVDSLLDVSALETSHMHFYDRVYDFADVIAKCVAARQAEADRRRITLTLDLSEGPLRARGDREKLSRACGHLLDNALKFTPDGGDIAIESGMSGETRGEEMLFIAIADSGGGIDPKKLARVTDPMVQADGSVTRLHGGAGLGLAFARRVAEGLGGGLSVESPPEQPVAGLLLHGTRVELHVATLARRGSLNPATGGSDAAPQSAPGNASGGAGPERASSDPSTAGSLRDAPPKPDSTRA